MMKTENQTEGQPQVGSDDGLGLSGTVLEALVKLSKIINDPMGLAAVPCSALWVSGWLTEFRCVKCGKAVSYITKMDSHGRCPLCGYKGKNAITIMDTIEVPYRLRRIAPAWKFWIKPERVYAQNADMEARRDEARNQTGS